VVIRSGPVEPDSRSDEIECAHCGAHFYYELLECPQCGAKVYGSEEIDEEDHPQAGEAGAPSGLEAGPLLLGLFTAALLLAALFLPLRGGLGIPSGSTPERLLLWALAAASAFPAGWLAGRFASRQPRLQGFLAGLGTSLLAVLLAAAVSGTAAPLLRDPISWAALPLTALTGLGGANLALRMLGTQAVNTLFGPVIQENLLYQRLLAIARNDREVVERLIAYERRQRPGASRVELMQMAIARWERDNR
jgi:hypothetical protein